MYVDKNVHRNLGSLPLDVIIKCLERLGNLGLLYVQLSEDNGVYVSEKLKDSIETSIPRLVSLVARNTFLSIMARREFNLEDLEDLEGQFEVCKKHYTSDDLRRLQNYLSNLQEYRNSVRKLAYAAQYHSQSIEHKLETESSLNVKLVEFCEFLRQRVRKLSAANPKQTLDNGRQVEAFSLPLTVAATMSKPKLEFY
ncbi:hypothetical protein CJU90_3333 [Yarrowia sp. C11]|nr:hypothetical protein CKK34_4779 [Yarrowia sp. E02]KAG5369799.1 hypothetical protein CJU90_3333 [Yarrowia sp. C11]